jgi:hypothetical protein
MELAEGGHRRLQSVLPGRMSASHDANRKGASVPKSWLQEEMRKRDTSAYVAPLPRPWGRSIERSQAQTRCQSKGIG